MASMPNIFEEVERDAAAVGHGITGLFRHNRNQHPADRPGTMAPTGASTQGEPVSLAQLEDDVKTDLTDGLNWLTGFATRLQQAAPGIIATSEALGSTTLGKFAEIALGKILPPDVEQELLTIAGRYFSTWGVPAAAAAPAQQGTPAQ